MPSILRTGESSVSDIVQYSQGDDAHIVCKAGSVPQAVDVVWRKGQGGTLIDLASPRYV